MLIYFIFSLCIQVGLLICLFSPNFCMLLHSGVFRWKNKIPPCRLINSCGLLTKDERCKGVMSCYEE